MLWLLLQAAQAGTMSVHMLDVGQGDAILLETPAGVFVLVDAGTKKAQVWNQLKALGVKDLELVIASHPHADHIGGMAEVVKRFDIELYLDSGLPHTTDRYADLMESLETRKVPHRRAEWGEVLTLDDGIELSVLWPSNTYLRGTRSDLNSNSVVIRVDHGDDCFLLMGDAEYPTELAVQRGGLGQCDVLKVAHHGSDHSSSPAFLRAVAPKIALISVGTDNRYGHPGEGTLHNLQRQQATIYRTDSWGTISLESSGHGIEVVDGRPWWSPTGLNMGTVASQGAGLGPAKTTAADPSNAPTAPGPHPDPGAPGLDPAALSGVRNVESPSPAEGSQDSETQSGRQARRERRRAARESTRP